MRYRQTKTRDLVQMRECNENGATYGIIAVKPQNRYEQLSDAERVLVAFMAELQHSFAIAHTTSLHMETFLHSGRSSVTQYWQDQQQQDWKVKGWTDGATLAVLYIKNISDVPVGKEDSFLNGAWFV